MKTELYAAITLATLAVISLALRLCCPPDQGQDRFAAPPHWGVSIGLLAAGLIIGGVIYAYVTRSDIR
ncbi:hypothetical protein [Blastopirellula marina]|uniref:Uncharacterized protein n=1 Tax=Blastopirellula marina TaxID=124 RepID=A0A2S8GT24_9BACT|nr:hypothetical protein [Blastopirellula marina]PQO47569.1 hypothetical protein C5Y93_02600 [Blastopirellula marina]